MAKYTLTESGKNFTTKKSILFMKWMMDEDEEHWDNESDFISEYAKKQYFLNRIILRIDTRQHFIEDLKKNNLLIIEEQKSLFSKFF